MLDSKMIEQEKILRQQIAELQSKLVEINNTYEKTVEIRRKIRNIQEDILEIIPKTIEGYLQKDKEDDKVYFYVGCPGKSDSIVYDRTKDINEICDYLDGDYIRITIERVPTEERQCSECDKRFLCFTKRK
jgi:hypothetical protein